MKRLVPVARVVLGAWLLLVGLNHFLLSLWPVPTGQEPLAMQLMAAFVHSGLFDVAMAILLVTGALILAGLFVPVALCAAMPVLTCALYWALVLDRQPLGMLLALAAFALNALLMLAHLGYYGGALQRHALTLGEAPGKGTYFESVYVHPGGRTARGHFVAALLTLLAVVAFYALLVTGRTAHWCLLVLVFPAIVLLVRRLHDMGRSGWLLLAPVALVLVAFAIWLDIASLGTRLDHLLPLAAFVVSAGFALWGCLGAHRSGIPEEGS